MALVAYVHDLEGQCQGRGRRHRMGPRQRASLQPALLTIFEKVLYKLPVKGPLDAPHGNIGARWDDAMFLGYHRNSNCYIVGIERGVVVTRSLQRRPLQER